MIELRGQVVTLKTLEREHCRVLWEANELEEPIATEPINPGLSVEGAGQWFSEMQAQQGRTQIYLGIFTHAGALVGDIQLAEISWRYRSAELGVGISRQADRRQGYGLDASRTLIRFGFEHLDLYRIGAHTFEYNIGAQHLVERCNFHLEGRERQAVYCAGQRWDRLVFGLLRPEFAATA